MQMYVRRDRRVDQCVRPCHMSLCRCLACGFIQCCRASSSSTAVGSPQPSLPASILGIPCGFLGQEYGSSVDGWTDPEMCPIPMQTKMGPIVGSGSSFSRVWLSWGDGDVGEDDREVLTGFDFFAHLNN